MIVRRPLHRYRISPPITDACSPDPAPPVRRAPMSVMATSRASMAVGLAPI